MKNPNFLLQVLPVLTIFLCIIFFIIYKILSRIKDQARGNPDSGKLSEFKLATAEKMPGIERIKTECPAIIERSDGFIRVGIREITLNGAFVTCPRPLEVGETFQIKMIFQNQNPLTLEADVVWNNNNVPGDQVVARGMKVRFLKLSDEDRLFLNEMFAAA